MFTAFGEEEDLSRATIDPLLAGKTLYDQNMYNDALKAFSRILEASKNNPDLYFYIGMCHYYKNN